MNSFYTYILDTLFPRRCISCKKEGFSICQDCISKIKREERLPGETLAVFAYRDPVMRKIIWNLKYKGKSNIAEDLAGILSDTILGELEDLLIYDGANTTSLVPLPMSKKRLKARGKNHTLTLAHAISNRTNIEVYDCLYKNKDTVRQALIKNRAKRLLNVKNSMELKSGFSVKGKNIVLVDDIVTTGATIEEAKRVLKKSGARKVIALVVAH